MKVSELLTTIFATIHSVSFITSILHTHFYNASMLCSLEILLKIVQSA